VRAQLQDISDRAGGISETPPPRRMFDSVRAATSKQGIGTFLNTLETRFFSNDAGLNNRVRDALKGNPDWNNARETLLSLSTGQALHADGIATEFLQKGRAVYNPELKKYVVVEDSNNFIGIINELSNIAKEENISYDLLKQYANQAFIAERVNGMSKTDKEFYSNLTPEQVQAGLEFFNAIPRLRDVQRIWNGVRQNTMDMAVESGLYTREEATDLLNVMDYVPFFREDQVESGAGPQGHGRGLLNFAKGRKIKGSDQKINDIFQNMESWTNYTVSRSVKNNTANNMLETAQRFFPDEVTEIRSDDQIRMEDRNNIIDIFVGGQRKRFKFADPLFVDAFGGMSGAGTPILGAFGQGASKAANVLRQSIVLIPLFSLAQLSMDSGSAMFTSGLKQPMALPLEIMSEFTKTLAGKSKAHERLSSMAATGIRDYMATVAQWDKELRSGLPTPTIGQRILKPFEKFAMASDNAVRQGIYNRTLLETGGIRMPNGSIRGGDEAIAVERAFEVINYKRSGNNGVVQVLRQTIPFFGAYLQATNVMYKVATGRGISPTQRNKALATLATTTAKVMALAFLYTALVSDSEEYRAMDPALRDSTLLIPGTMFRLPMRPDIFLFPKLISEYGYKILTDDGYTDGVKMRRGMKDALVNAITGPTAVPQFAKPLFEVSLNYDYFSGRPIVGRGLERLPTDQQYSANSSELAKMLGRTGLIAPVNADHLMRGYFGTLGGLANMFISSAVRTTEGRSAPTMSLSDELAAIPSVGRFITREFGSGARNDFYELRREVDSAVAGFNNLRRVGRFEEAVEFRDKNQRLLQLRTQVNRVQDQLSTLRKRRTQVIEAPDSQISANEKGEIIRQLNERERAILQQVYDMRRRAGF
jgi:predicted DNA binding protein